MHFVDHSRQTRPNHMQFFTLWKGFEKIKRAVKGFEATAPIVKFTLSAGAQILNKKAKYFKQE